MLHDQIRTVVGYATNYNLQKLFVQIQPQEYFLFLLVFFDLCSGGLCCICCFRVRSFFHNNPLFGVICFFVFPAFFTFFARGVLESAGLCFVPSKFLCLRRTYGYLGFTQQLLAASCLQRRQKTSTPPHLDLHNSCQVRSQGRVKSERILLAGTVQ